MNLKNKKIFFCFFLFLFFLLSFFGWQLFFSKHTLKVDFENKVENEHLEPEVRYENLDEARLIKKSLLTNQCFNQLKNKERDAVMIKGDLSAFISSLNSLEDVSSAISTLIDKGFFSFDDGFEYFKNISIFKFDFLGKPKAVHYTQALDEHKVFFEKYKNISLYLQGNKKRSLSEIINESKKYENLSLNVFSSKGGIFISIKQVLSENLDLLSNDEKAWVLDNINFDGKSIELAIKSSLNGPDLNLLIDRTPNYRRLYVQENGRLGNEVTATLKYSEVGLVSSILKKRTKNENFFIVPIVNQFLESNQNNSRDDFDEILSLLVENDFHAVSVNPESGDSYLLGYPNLLVKNLNLRSSDLQIIDVDEWIESLGSDNLNLEDEQLFLTLIDELEYSNKDIARAQKKCSILASERNLLEPEFKGVTLNDSFFNYQEEIKELASISPVLVDAFIGRTSLAPNVGGGVDVETIFANFGNDIDRLYEQSKLLSPPAQTMLAAKVCDVHGEKAMLDFVSKGLFIIFMPDAFQQCTDNYDSAWGVLSGEMNNLPGNIYALIGKRDYEEALSQLSRGIGSTFGYSEYGRDALGLLLDRLVRFRTNEPESAFQLLDELIKVTSLQDYHFRRFKRFALKYPEYFSRLAGIYPQLNLINEHSYSRYNSYF